MFYGARASLLNLFIIFIYKTRFFTDSRCFGPSLILVILSVINIINILSIQVIIICTTLPKY